MEMLIVVYNQTTAVMLLLFGLAMPEISILRIALSFVAFAVFLFIEESEYTTEPIVPVGVLKMRSVLLTCTAALGLMIARWGVLFFAPVYAIAVRGWSSSAGLTLVSTNGGFAVGGTLVGWVHIRKATSYYMLVFTFAMPTSTACTALTEKYSSCLIVYFSFACVMFALALLSSAESSAAVYFIALFLNGFFAGALVNYTLSHVLHLTSPHVSYIVTSLVAMARGFAGSFGSALGGGLFERELKKFITKGFMDHGLFGRDDLIRKLMGSPAMVMELTGVEKEIAVQGYEHAVKRLFLVGGIMAFLMIFVQAGTGWRPFEEIMKAEEEEEETLLHRDGQDSTSESELNL